MILTNNVRVRKKMLEGLAYKGIVKENNKQINKYDLEVEVDNKYFDIKYPQGSIVETARNLIMKKLRI